MSMGVDRVSRVPVSGFAKRAVLGAAWRCAAWRCAAWLLPCGFALVSPGLAAKPQVTARIGAKNGATDAALNAYIERVNAANDARVRTPGSLWSDDGRLIRLSSDLKATNPHDLISIVVSETLTASTDGTVKDSRASTGSSQVAALFGTFAAASRMQNLLSSTASSALNAQGQSATNSSLSTTVGGEVVAVLPNGVFVIQADRQLAFNQQTQTIRMRGLVRPDDVNSQNQVLSTAITDMELEVVGKGIINDATYRQNPLVRFIERLVVF